MLGLPNPYVIGAAILLTMATLTGTFLFGASYERKIWVAKIAEQKIEAGKVLATALQRVRDKENQDAENARKIDESHAAEVAAAHAGRDKFAERLRIARRGAGCPNPGSTEAADTGVSPDSAPVSDNGPGSADPGNRLRDAALELQRYAKACHAFATEVGR